MDVLKSFHESLLAAKAGNGVQLSAMRNLENLDPASKGFLKDSGLCRFEDF